MLRCGLINTATSGLRTSAGAIKDMFATSEAIKVEYMADHTIEKVRKEFTKGLDPNILNIAVDDFLPNLTKKFLIIIK